MLGLWFTWRYMKASIVDMLQGTLSWSRSVADLALGVVLSHLCCHFHLNYFNIRLTEGQLMDTGVPLVGKSCISGLGGELSKRKHVTLVESLQCTHRRWKSSILPKSQPHCHI